VLETKKVDRTARIHVKMAPGGGQAIRVRPGA